MSLVDWCCSYSHNNSSKSLKNKLHSLSVRRTSQRSLPSAIRHLADMDRYLVSKSLAVTRDRLGPNLLTRIFLCWSWKLLVRELIWKSESVDSEATVFVEAICRCSFKTDCNVEVEKLNALTLNENRWIENNVVKVGKLMVLMLRNICWSRYQVVDFDLYFLSWILLQFGYHNRLGMQKHRTFF